MYVATVPNRKSPPAILLRESYREGSKVRTRTLANLSHWPAAQIEALRAVLRGATSVAVLEEAFEVSRSLAHGHVAAVVGTMRKLGLARLISARNAREQRLCLAMIAARVLRPGSKLALTRQIDPQLSSSSLGQSLGLEEAVDEDELYRAMDWLLERQSRIETTLARRQLSEGSLVLYDLTSTYFEGRRCPLARIGYSRDGKKNRPQIVFGLLTDAEGCPVAVEVFEGNTGDPTTVASQVEKLRRRFGLGRVVLVGDRGMITSARIEQDLKPQPGLGWITSLRSPAIRKLVEGGFVQMSLFDQRDLVEITSPDFPGERLIVCRNPLLAEERKRKREELLTATEKALEKVAQATRRSKNRLQGEGRIGLRVGKVLGRFKMTKHFRLTIEEYSFGYERDLGRIEQEAGLDGLYVIRTSVPQAELSAEEAVRSYKRLSRIERAFRCLKTMDLKVRPIHHRLARRVRAHVLICMLAYYVEWHMRRALAPLLFEDHDKPTADRLRRSVVAPAQRSPKALRKARTKRTEDGSPVHSFHTLLEDLASVAKTHIKPRGLDLDPFVKISNPTSLQQKAFDLLGVSPHRM
jgi:transposase